MPQSAIFDKVIARAWSDPAFKATLLTDPATALAAFGASVPAGLTVKVVENTQDLDYVVIPLPPAGELSDENVAEATGFYLHDASGEAVFIPFCRWCPFCLDMIAKAWRDPAFKAQLLTDPRAAVIAMGAEVRVNETIRVLENTAHLVHLVLPLQPKGELSTSDLEMVAGGVGDRGTAQCWIARSG